MERQPKTRIEDHYELVWYIVRKAQKSVKVDLEIDDLFQEGCIGLQKAIEKYDPSLGYKFSTLACWHIKAAIYRAIRFSLYHVHVPNGKKPTLKMMSLNSSFTPDDSNKIHPSGEDDCSPDNVTILHMDSGIARNLIKTTLRKREREVIISHYFEGKNMAQIGEEMHITRERVRQLRNRGINILRSCMAS